MRILVQGHDPLCYSMLIKLTRGRLRFRDDPYVHLSLGEFRSFDYPACDLLCADASLFFCDHRDFDLVWERMCSALNPHGIFCGSFLGPRDTMACPENDSTVVWPDVLIFDEPSLRACFAGMHLLRWTEHELDGTTAEGKAHHWHIFSVVAKRP